MKHTHAQLKREVMKAVNRLPGVFVFPAGVGSFVSTYKGKKRFIRLGMAGTPDLVGYKRTVWDWNATTFRVPQFIALEIKVGKDKLRPEQAAFLEKVREAGGIALEIRSMEQAVEALR